MESYMDHSFTEWIKTYGPTYQTFKRIEEDLFIVEEEELSMHLLRKESEWFQEQFPAIVCSLIVENYPLSRTYYFEFLLEGRTFELTYKFKFFMDHRGTTREVLHNFNGTTMTMFVPPFLDFQEPFHDIATAFIEWVESQNENRLLVVTS